MGGLVGWHYSGSITNYYSNGSVGTGTSVGGLVGYLTSGQGATTSNSFWDTQTSGQSSSAGGTGKTTALMKTQSTFTDAGWDFTNVWEMIGTNYPRLKSIPEAALPVELTSFTASVSNNAVALRWSTATEINNYGFDIERRVVKSEQLTENSWVKIGFVAGNGTSNVQHSYIYADNSASSGTYVYRLKQIYNDGTFKYSQESEVSLSPKTSALHQNYPNPFNPTTQISYDVATVGNVRLAVYDILGREVAVLVNEQQSPGSYKAQFNASQLSSGIYFFKLTTNQFSSIRKMLMIK